MRVRFEIVDNLPPTAGTLKYITADHGFFLELDPVAALLHGKATASASLMVDGYLSLDVGIPSGFLYKLDGLHPQTAWRRGRLPAIQPEPCGMRARIDEELIPGVGYTLVPEGQWITIHDVASGWIYVGPEAIVPAERHIGFAANTVAALTDGQLLAIWLRPEFV